jgi:hypothetical protein
MTNYEAGMAKLIEMMREDYAKFKVRTEYCKSSYEEVYAETEDMFTVESGRVYDKIIYNRAGSNGRSVNGFVCRKDTKKFKTGDMLMAAGWNGPATNFRRGNVIEGINPARVRWTGIL